MDVTNPELRNYFQDLSARRGTGSIYQTLFDQVQEDWVDSDGLKIHLDILEAGQDKPTVVFMPGTSAYALIYGEYLALLGEAGYNVVGFDPRGHGRSQGKRGSYTMPELVRDMGAAVQYARNRFGDPVAVSGSSQGGITAFYYAAGDDSLAGAVCHNIADLPHPDSIRLTRHPSVSRLFKPMIPVLAKLVPELKVPLAAYLDLNAEHLRGIGPVGSMFEQDPLLVPYIRLKGMASLGVHPLPVPVEKIKTPICILHGEGDYIFPRDYVEDIYQRLTCPKALMLYKGLPHYLLFDHLDKVFPDVEAWLAEIFG